MTFTDVNAWRKRLTTADHVAVLVKGLTNLVEILWRTVAATVVLMALLLTIVAAVVTVVVLTVRLLTIVTGTPVVAVLIVSTVLRTLAMISALLLAWTIIIRATLILWSGLQQRTGTDHQDTQTCNQTGWHFHVSLLEIRKAKRGSVPLALNPFLPNYLVCVPRYRFLISPIFTLN
jgi:hypothetical protein